MPGAFAHMIAADLAKSRVEGGSPFLAKALNRYNEWLQAGAVGPDYPYLHRLIFNDASNRWADLMHYQATGDMVRAGLAELKPRFVAEQNDPLFMRSAAWLFGYASHVVLDASIHPVVRAIVGEYAAHKTEHRACEMVMDSWIYKETYRVELINAEWADFMRALTVGGGMDPAVATLWRQMLQTVHPAAFNQNPPQIDGWQKGYVTALDAADLNVGFFRHAAEQKGVVYVPVAVIPGADRTRFIEQAALPKNNRFGKTAMHYRDIHQFGVDRVVRFWGLMEGALKGEGDPELPELLNWNLDTGTLIGKEENGDATLWV
ncbi:MAG: hypothetical protein AUJ55_01330 [Proteobacteria bacterium CG1_02_64_396]|nr:MAG: hypothetical protein AUJ55_01330 [Proteobacteria bacterium CG1_02_64_396]